MALALCFERGALNEGDTGMVQAHRAGAVLTAIPEIMPVLRLFSVGAMAGPVNRITLVNGPNRALFVNSQDFSPCSCPKLYADAAEAFLSMYFRTCAACTSHAWTNFCHIYRTDHDRDIVASSSQARVGGRWYCLQACARPALQAQQGYNTATTDYVAS